MGSLLEALYQDLKQKSGDASVEKREERAPLLAPSIKQIPSSSNANTVVSAASRTYATSSTSAAVAGAAHHAQQVMQTLHMTGSTFAAVGAVASVAGPIGMASSMAVDKVAQLRRWWKTKVHHDNLILIYFMALDAQQDQKLLDAIIFAIGQKKQKQANAGLKALIPAVVALENQYTHLTKLWNGTLNLKEHEAAKTLFEYFEHSNEYAQRAIAELFSGGGKGLEDLVAKINLRETEVDTTMQRSDDHVPESDEGFVSGSGSAWSDKTGFSQLHDEDTGAKGKAAKLSFLQKAAAKIKGQAQYTPLDATYEQEDEAKEKCIRKIMDKLKPS